MDGPVVKAAKRALETSNVNLILPYASKEAESELKAAFERTLRVRKTGKEAADLADYWFYETAVRLHREGEGAPFTGLKPAGLDIGPVVPKADLAVETGNPKQIIEFLTHILHEDLHERFEHIMAKKDYDVNDIHAAREYIHAMLGFVIHTHNLYTTMRSGNGHGEEKLGTHEHS